MEYKLFGTPQFHDEAWYANREAADHINEPAHRIRLLEAIRLVETILFRYDLDLKTLADWGAGNGGLLHEFKANNRAHGLTAWGYDLCPKNVEFATKNYAVDVSLMNIVSGDPMPADIVILTELLEHLVSPHDLLDRLLHPSPQTRWIVASTPGFEDFQNHYEFHLWAWTGESFANMFRSVGWIVKRHFTRAEAGTQFVVAMNPELQ